jgi:hypothetical protein
MTDARQVMVRPMVRAGAGFHTLAVASTTEQALEATLSSPATCHRWKKGT